MTLGRESDATGDIQAYKKLLATYFRQFDLLPILISANQQVGDVYDVANKWSYLSSGTECFPSLGDLEEVNSTLPQAIDIQHSQLGAAVGLAKFLSFKGSLDRASTITLKFTDAKIRRASRIKLQRALCPDCEFLRPIVLEEMKDYQAGQSLPIVVGSVMSAKRQIFVGGTQGRHADVTANLSHLAAGLPLEIIQLDPSVSATMGYGQNWGCLLQSKDRMPVAVAPAFFPQLVFDRTQGDGRNEAVGVQWRSAEESSITGWLDEAATAFPPPDTF